MKKNLLGLMSGTALAIGVGVMSAAPAEALLISGNYGGSSYLYDIQVRPGSFTSLEPELTEQDWWGDYDLANQLSAQIQSTLGNYNNGPVSYWGPTFAVANLGSLIDIRYWLTGGGYVVDDDPNPFGRVRGYAVAEGGNLALASVPTPAAVLPGLFGIGLSAIRKRRVASSEEA